MQTLTRIEKLDQKLPGLADQVSAWFNEGLSTQRVVDLLTKWFGLRVPRSTVGSFRARRWMRDRQMARDQLALAQVAEAALQELEMRAYLEPRLAPRLAPHDVKLTTYFLLDERSHLEPVTQTAIEYGPGLRRSGHRAIKESGHVAIGSSGHLTTQSSSDGAVAFQ